MFKDRRHWELRAGRWRLLSRDAKRGEILGLCSDGSVRNVGDTQIGEKFDLAGPASDDLKAGSRVVMAMGRWVRS